ncbi:major facilitator superfamily domain-containing protein [Microdochium trichocladiopsis]|uniref:Major facilitator superfamily domain-containing protein n=1 Tax=Microdochium trichocladiopsis TaxID=1682393 RepID=A0A9P9BQS0_9PEZI|nr:major facilitator superfamily domain-containing protein [Microdochium trichocladiopsis]KAH7031202.1 major facilitator superfamily domain-containing protein [Microdochium trichocladiopsis]
MGLEGSGDAWFELQNRVASSASPSLLSSGSSALHPQTGLGRGASAGSDYSNSADGSLDSDDADVARHHHADDIDDLRASRKSLPRHSRMRTGHHSSGDDTASSGHNSRASSVASFQLYTPDEENAVVRKFDRRLVLFLSLCYMLSFLDRSNIGNARIAGMEEDLQTSPPRDEWYEWSLSSFYISYIAFEWMALLWRLIPAHIYVSAVILSWGIIASLQAIATSYPILIFLRTLLGIGEAAFTGVPFYLSFFYKRHELAYRTAMFISAAPLATTFASSLAWLILKVGEAGPIAPWRLLFLAEGFPSVIVATLAWSIIPDTPGSASYLTPRERKVARLRLRHAKSSETKSHGASPQSGFKARELFAVFVDYTAWIMAFMFFLTNMAYASLPVFLPTIIREMGFTALEAQAFSAPPYLVSFISVYVTAWLSDRSQSRAGYVIFHALCSAAGYAVLALAQPLSLGHTARYLAVYPAAMGFFNVVVLTIAWTVNNQQSESRRGGGFALLQVIGQCGPIVGTRLYPKKDGPFFEPGMRACAAAMLGVAVLALALRIVLAWQNRKLAADQDEATEYVALETFESEADGLVASLDREANLQRDRSREVFRYML